MTSDEARELFSSAYDDELSADERASFDATLANDAELRDEFDEFRRMLGAARMLTEDDDSPAVDLLAGVQDKLRARSGGRFYRDRFSQKSGSRSLMPILITGVMLLIIAVAWLMIHYVHVEAEGLDADAASQTDRP